MPRIARIKAPDTIHHVMCRSISELTLFKNYKDKVKYLELLALYCEKFQCSILSYCLMDTHVHIQLDPRGSDMSKFMHGVNLCYAQYYNQKYRRHGHVFQGRFLSRAANLCNKGYELIKLIPKYQNIYPEILVFIKPKAS